MISQNKVYALSQILNTLSDSVKKLEEFYDKKDIENFKIAKEEILQLHQKVSETLKGK
jgi:hypothetical protein